LNGEYSFDFTFIQVEKHTLNIFATKDGYVLGNSISTIIVGGGEGGMAGPQWFSDVGYYAIGFLVIVFVVAWLITKKKKGRRK